ncbi:MAG: GAF domain-containing protein [Bacteroidia bacterium]|nr:GAF domain-containing protein [Bacteroidia bacterium]
MKFRLTVSRKISIGFAIVILLTIVSSSVILNTSTSLVTKFSKDISPSLSIVEDFNIMVTESKMYITNWVYLPSSLEDKEALKRLQTKRYPSIKVNILKLYNGWDEVDKKRMDTVFLQYKELTSIQEEIMKELVTFDDYEDPMKKLFSEERIESEVLPLAADITNNLKLIAKHLNKNANDIRFGMFESFENLQWLIIGIALFIICLGVFITIMTVKTIVGPIKMVRQILLRMGLGELPENVTVSSNDEIGDMTTALNQLIDSGNKSASFASNIGGGDFSVQFEKLSDKDILGTALINMREDLKEAARKKELEKWAADGQVKFADIFNKHDALTELGDEVINSLVDYLDSSQARLYVANDAEEIKLELLASTFKNESKAINGKLSLGEGIVGEVARDRQMKILDTIPKGYFESNGGNGKLNKLVVSPLITENKLFGVIEIATNDEFMDHHISFIEQLGEKIAIKVNSTIINQRTRELLQKVHDSITYAERIQKSMLPTQETIQEHFRDSFMFYKPKDVVSGDFPWFADMGDEKLIAV